MKVYVDNDIAVKLAKWGLLDRFTLHLTKQGKADLYMVRSLPYRFSLKDPIKAAALLGSAAAVSQLTNFAATCKPPLGHDPTVAAALTDVASIDAGEAALFAAAAHYDAALVDTGDKNALRAVGKLDPDHIAVQALAGKLACLEQTLHYLVGRWTFDVVHKAVSSCSSADTAATKCFAAGDEAKALQSLAAKADELKPHCGALLAPKPFGWIV